MMAQAGPDLPRAFRAMKYRYRTQALLNLGFYLIERRPVLFFVAIIFFVLGGHRWLSNSQHSYPRPLVAEGFGMLVQRQRQHLL
jgi:hypothetical protein